MTEKKLRLSALIDEGYALRGPQKWPAYTGGETDRTKYVTSSEVGKCARMVKFSKDAVPVPFVNWGYAERGNVIEAWAADLIRDALGDEHPPSWLLLHAGNEQVSFATGYQSGTPDGVLISNQYEAAVIEIKSVDPRTNYSRLPKKEHVKQLQQNMYLVNAEAYTVIGGLLIYIDASNLQKREEFVVSVDEAEQERLKKRAEWVMTTPVEEIPAEGMVVDRGCDYCDFVNECNDLIRKKLNDNSEMQNAERASNNVFKI